MIQRPAEYIACLVSRDCQPKYRIEADNRFRRIAHDLGELSRLLNSWIIPDKVVPLAAMPVWQRLMKAAAHDQAWLMLNANCGSRPLHPVVFHGDLAPWNVKVSRSGTWTVLDWERGELEGVPCWDWFHYVLQSAVLVEGLSVQRLLARTETLLESEPFKGYCTRTGVCGCERELLLAYLLHCVEVLKPSEGLSTTRELFRALLAAKNRR